MEGTQSNATETHILTPLATVLRLNLLCFFTCPWVAPLLRFLPLVSPWHLGGSAVLYALSVIIACSAAACCAAKTSCPEASLCAATESCSAAVQETTHLLSLWQATECCSSASCCSIKTLWVGGSGSYCLPSGLTA